MKSTNSFSPELLIWYQKHARNLPWRSTSNPYLIWVSEVILQQTRVVQGLQYFDNFIEKFPTISDLATANEEKVLKVWQGLGYYSRARNMQFSAKQVVQDFGGVFPTTYAEILTLKGIGAYTAAAISSIAFGEVKVAIDGNVKRVAARVFGIKNPVNLAATDKEIGTLLLDCIPNDRPGDFNQAMMELGALVCTPSTPLCESCPFQSFCFANKYGLQKELPVKAKKALPKIKYVDFAFIDTADTTYLIKRPSSGIWGGLFEFPNIYASELKQNPNPVEIFKEFLLDTSKVDVAEVFEVKHQLTHQTIFARFWHIRSKAANIVKKKNLIETALQDLDNFPVHRLMLKFLEKQGLTNKTLQNDK